MKIGTHTYGGASVQLSLTADFLPPELAEKCWWVSHLATEPANRRQGNAKELLRRVCVGADNSGKSLLLIPSPEQDQPVDVETLQMLYRRFGFQMIQDEPILMARYARH